MKQTSYISGIFRELCTTFLISGMSCKVPEKSYEIDLTHLTYYQVYFGNFARHFLYEKCDMIIWEMSCKVLEIYLTRMYDISHMTTSHPYERCRANLLKSSWDVCQVGQVDFIWFLVCIQTKGSSTSTLDHFIFSCRQYSTTKNRKNPMNAQVIDVTPKKHCFSCIFLKYLHRFFKSSSRANQKKLFSTHSSCAMNLEYN